MLDEIESSTAGTQQRAVQIGRNIAPTASAAPAETMGEANEKSTAPAKNIMGKMAKTMCWSSERTSPVCIVSKANTNALSRNPVRAVISPLPLSGTMRRTRKMMPPTINVTSNRSLAILRHRRRFLPAVQIHDRQRAPPVAKVERLGHGSVDREHKYHRKPNKYQ